MSGTFPPPEMYSSALSYTATTVDATTGTVSLQATAGGIRETGAAIIRGDKLSLRSQDSIGLMNVNDVRGLAAQVNGSTSNLSLKNGRSVKFKSYDQPRSAFQQAALNGAWCDEEMPREIWQELQTRLIKYRGRTLLTFSPIDGTAWLHELFFNEKNAKWIDFVSMGMHENTHLPKEEVEQYIATFQDDPDQLAIRVFSGDTAPCDNILELSRGADLLIHECTFTEAFIKSTSTLFKVVSVAG